MRRGMREESATSEHADQEINKDNRPCAWVGVGSPEVQIRGRDTRKDNDKMKTKGVRDVEARRATGLQS
jgi:hypothetical protein